MRRRKNENNWHTDTDSRINWNNYKVLKDSVHITKFFLYIRQETVNHYSPIYLIGSWMLPIPHSEINFKKQEHSNSPVEQWILEIN